MKNLTKIFILPAFAFFAPLAVASTYLGSWHNTTFDSTGDLTVEFDIQGNEVMGSIDADGNVFGGEDPPAIPFNATLNEDGSGTINILGTPMGDISGSVDADGKLTVIINNIPGGFLTEARFNGLFDLELEKLDMTYEIDNALGLFAEGTAEAHVPKKPVVDAPRKVKFSGKTGKITAIVLTNTDITDFKAKAKGAKVRVKGGNPYKIILRNAKKKVTRVKLTTTNADGFKARKNVKFIRK